MNIRLTAKGKYFEGFAALPPKREKKFYVLEQEKTGEIVLTRIGKRGGSVVGVFRPTMSRYSRGNISGIEAELSVEGRTAFISIEEN